MDDCPTCVALWNEYAKAATNHIALGRKLLQAMRQGNHAMISDLTQAMESAYLDREQSRDTLRLHSITVHAKLHTKAAS